MSAYYVNPYTWSYSSPPSSRYSYSSSASIPSSNNPYFPHLPFLYYPPPGYSSTGHGRSYSSPWDQNFYEDYRKYWDQESEAQKQAGKKSRKQKEKEKQEADRKIKLNHRRIDEIMEEEEKKLREKDVWMRDEEEEQETEREKRHRRRREEWERNMGYGYPFAYIG